MKRLLLFDIDGTLVRSNGAGREMLGESMRAVYGTAGSIATYEFGGRTDRRMVQDLLVAEGWTPAEIETRLPALYEEMARQSRRLFANGRFAPCPGVVALLAALRHEESVLLGLLTGNIAGTAPLKLRAAGLNPNDFRVGAFGSDSMERNDLLTIAWQRAEAVSGKRFGGADTVVIGDTPADILCAQQGQALAVAVATGWTPPDRLRACGPAHLFADLSQTEAVLSVLLG